MLLPCSGGKEPHAQAVGAIISGLDLAPEELEMVPYSCNGHDGVDEQFAPSVVDKVRSWLEDRDWPSPVTVNGKGYKVLYREARHAADKT